MSSGSRKASSGRGVGGAEQVEGNPGEASLECSEGFHRGVSVGASALVVGPSESVEANLGDRDAVQGGVELPVTAAGEPVSVGLARGGGNGSDSGVHGEAGFGAEPGRIS